MNDLAPTDRRVRMLLATLGSRGDVEPFVHLARAARAAGHEVRLAVPDDTDLDVSGLDAVRLGISFSDLAEQARGPGGGVRAFRERIRPAMRRALTGVVETAMAWQPEVIVAHPKLLTVPVVAHRLDVPHVLVELTPTITPTGAFPAAGIASRSLGPALNRLSYRAVGLAGSVFGAELRAARTALGIRPGVSLPPPAGTLVAISPTLLPRPADWPAEAHLTGAWRGRGGPGELDAALRDFIADDAPFVVAGFGSMTGGDAVARATAIVDGARAAGARTLLVTGWGGLASPAGRPGPDVLVVASAPHDPVMPRAVAAIHHGGAGTVHSTTRAGTPSIVMPFFGDQPFWAAQLRRRGLGGPPLDRRRLSSGRVRAAIDDAIGRAPRVAEAARSMAAEDGTAVATSVIASLR